MGVYIVSDSYDSATVFADALDGAAFLPNHHAGDVWQKLQSHTRTPVLVVAPFPGVCVQNGSKLCLGRCDLVKCAIKVDALDSCGSDLGCTAGTAVKPNQLNDINQKAIKSQVHSYDRQCNQSGEMLHETHAHQSLLKSSKSMIKHGIPTMVDGVSTFSLYALRILRALKRTRLEVGLANMDKRAALFTDIGDMFAPTTNHGASKVPHYHACYFDL